MKHTLRFPVSTYRLQFNSQFTFAMARELVDYLHQLGVTHCYASPLVKAKAGSLHGYDTIDHSQLNPEIGTQEEFELFVKELKKNNMGLILDIVPNHMYAFDRANRWWNDILENGPSSPFADYFDIDWRPLRSELGNKVLLPLLEQQYGEAVESQAMKVVYREEGEGAFFVELHGQILPTDPKAWTIILEPLAKEVAHRLTDNHPHLIELQSIVTALSHLPLSSDMDKEKVTERMREKEVVKRRLQTLLEQSELIKNTLTEVLIVFNGTKEDPQSFNRLEAFLNSQNYRLCFWRVANDEINYRRFFDIVALAGLRTEKKEVFEATHALIFDFIQKKLIDGIRIDHIDGLWNPEQYLNDLHAGSPKEKDPQREIYIVGEKILTGTEKLRPQWPIHGTVGYDFLNQSNGLFVYQANRKAILDIYYAFTDVTPRISDHIYASKKLILLSSMSSELSMLAKRLDRISEQHRSSRDFSTESLKAALRDTIACFPVYRSYVDAPAGNIDEDDRISITTAINRAKRLNPTTNPSIFDFIYRVLLLQYPQGISEQEKAIRDNFVMQFQQLTSPVMAKGVEDTAFYRYYPLSSLNEVGADFYSFGISIDAFHEKNRERLESWPYTMTTTSTHDTKRSKDVRMRINVLSEMPEEWMNAINRWSVLNEQHKGKESDEPVPDANEEYLLYQILVGTWPLYPMDPVAHVQYMNRILNYMDKAVKEAKINTSWINPNRSYEKKVREFIQKVLTLDSTENPFLAEFKSFIPKIITAGMLNSLNLLLLKMTSPGIPDTYQGSETWDYALVDPDNRKVVDFENRKYLLQSIQEGMKKHPRDFLQQLLHSPEDGRIKLFVTSRLLHFRKSEHEVFTNGNYIPLKVTGEKQNHVIAFAWQYENKVFIVIATRFFTTLMQDSSPIINPGVWENSKVILPKELSKSSFHNLFTKDEIAPIVQDEQIAIPIENALDLLPFAILI